MWGLRLFSKSANPEKPAGNMLHSQIPGSRLDLNPSPGPLCSQMRRCGPHLSEALEPGRNDWSKPKGPAGFRLARL